MLYFVFFLELLVVQRLAFDHVDCNAVGGEDNLGLIFIISLVLRLSWKQYRGKVGGDEDAAGRSENLSSSREVCLSNREERPGETLSPPTSKQSSFNGFWLNLLLPSNTRYHQQMFEQISEIGNVLNQKILRLFVQKNTFQGSIFNLQKTLVQVVFAIFSKNQETSFSGFYFSL